MDDTKPVEVKVKKWGNSMGVVIPAEVVDKLNIKPGQYANIRIEKKNTVLRDMFGAGKGKFKRPTEEILKEIRKEYSSKWDK